MSHLLWACYIADNVERFRRLLALTGHSAQAAAVWNGGTGGGHSSTGTGHGTGTSAGGSAGYGDLGGSPYATSPKGLAGGGGGGGGKARKASGYGGGGGGGGSGTIGKNEINSRDFAGLTILLRAASASTKSAIAFVAALLEHPATDIYVQDQESGWNALHRALYAGNISIARLLLERERRDIAGQTLGSSLGRIGRLIKTKDHEGNSPFELYNSTISKIDDGVAVEDDNDAPVDSDGEEAIVSPNRPLTTQGLQALVDGEDLFFFGSNKNLTLGMGDSDDRQFPERVQLQRPEHLLYRFYEEYVEKTPRCGETATPPTDVSELPEIVKSRPLLIRDAVLSKLHSAILTNDPVSNLYTCGVGRGGRLGLGDENTRFSFEPVQGPFVDKHIVKVALGQNHSMAIADNGQLWTWGSNTFSQLGYALPPSPKKDEDPMTSTPRQVFGPLRKETILGIAASAHHSVAHTGTSLYCWGRNVGQLALMDADSRSLDVQAVPRKVAASLFSANIVAVSAIDRATTVLLANHTVCVFTSYGYRIVKFDFTETLGQQGRLGNFNMSSRYDAGRSRINYIASGGETIAAVTSRGDLFTMSLTNVPDASQSSSSSSTTNPSKIRDSLTTPQCIWSARKDGVRSVDVGEQGSVIISTHSGAVWRRIKRVKAKDAHVGVGAQGSGRSRADMKKKDYKFQRVPFISNVVTVRSSAFGAFAAIRSDSNLIRGTVSGLTCGSLCDDVRRLSPLNDFQREVLEASDGVERTNYAQEREREDLTWAAYRILRSTDLVNELAQHFANWQDTYRNRDGAPPGVILLTTLHPEIRIPVHSWIVSGRSPVLRDALAQCRQHGHFELPEVFSATTEERADGHRAVVVAFAGMDMLSLLNLVVFLYDDKVVPVWNHTRQGNPLANRYRAVRAEVMKLATRLEMAQLEAAARVQTRVKPSMDMDCAKAIKDPRFFADADTLLELDGAEVAVHRELLCERSQWFSVLFYGRSKGQWLATRRQGLGPSDKLRIDMKHMNPQAFACVLQYLYTDGGCDFLDQLVVPDAETYFDFVIDVLGIADELMLHRLSQICQTYIGQRTTTRNVSQLLNAVSPCLIREFKELGLEYVCEQMETMLENHLLDDLDEDLLKDLDKTVTYNQLLKMSFVRSEIAEDRLLKKYPWLVHEIEEERNVRVREMAYKAAHRDDERRPSTTGGSASKGRIGSLDDPSSTAAAAAASAAAAAASPSASRSKKKSSRMSKAEQSSPLLRAKSSQADLMFSMEDDESALVLADRPRSRGNTAQTAQDGTLVEDGGAPGSLRDNHDNYSNSPATPSTPVRRPAVAAAASSRGFVRFGHAGSTAAAASPEPYSSSTPKGADTKAWGAAAVQTPSATPRLDLRSIMTETSTSPPFITKTSALSAGLDAQRAAAAEPVAMTAPPKIASAPKLSQKERKKQQLMQQQMQQQQDQAKNTPKGPAWDTGASGDAKRASLSWQSPSPVSTSVPGPSKAHLPPSSTASPGPSSGAVTPLYAVKKQPHTPAAASPDTRFAGQSRASPAGLTGSHTPAAAAPAAPLLPHSKVYIKPARKAEFVLGLTMADIFLQQQLEQESIKEAVAKRSLQEIQEEQRFQEWWDQESRRAQEEEAQRQAKGKGRDAGGSGGGNGASGGGGGSGRKKKGKAPAGSGAGSVSEVPGNAQGSAAPKKKKSAHNGASRSRGGGGGGGGGVGVEETRAGGDGQPPRRRGGGGGRGGKA